MQRYSHDCSGKYQVRSSVQVLTVGIICAIPYLDGKSRITSPLPNQFFLIAGTELGTPVPSYSPDLYLMIICLVFYILSVERADQFIFE